MITSLRLVNFKNFADETLRLGPFTVIVGANASGKSNIRDAFRFLHGIGRGYTLADILGGKYGAGGQLEWEGIRGAPNEIVRLRGNSRRKRGDFSVHLRTGRDDNKVSFSITARFNRARVDVFRVWKERLTTANADVYMTETGNTAKLHVIAGEDPERKVSLSRSQPALTQLLRPRRMSELRLQDSDLDIHSVLGRMRFFDFVPERMRQPSFPGQTVLGDGGENLATVLCEICADSIRGRNLISWLEELTPMDVKGLEFPRDPSGRIHLQIVERNGRKISAYAASDGTLRFLGILAALFGADESGCYFFEEIDNGIHPNRLWLLLEFIERQTDERNVQVVTTTHSPALLSWMGDTTFENTSVVYRDEYWTDSVIRPIADLYDLRKLRESFTLGELHTTGWLEHAMACSKVEPDADHLGDDVDDLKQGILE